MSRRELLKTDPRILASLAALLFLGIAAMWWAAAPLSAETQKEPMLAHNVYFSLKESNAANREKLVAACQKYLTGHPGTVFFAAGTVADLDRPVNDRDFDVGLHLIFESREAHDRYQTDPRHLEFIEENKETWAKVRVFDSDVHSSEANG